MKQRVCETVGSNPGSSNNPNMLPRRRRHSPPSRPPRPPSPPSPPGKPAPNSKDGEALPHALPPTPPRSPGFASPVMASLVARLPLRAEAAEPPREAGKSAVPDLPDDMIAKILHHLPQDEPACLLRASLVSKRWFRIVSDPDFRRRSDSDGTPPMLGLFLDDRHESQLRFTATTASAFSLPTAVPDSVNNDDWFLIDCRHGRALFISRWIAPPVLQIWEPMTGNHWVVPAPAIPISEFFVFHPIAAVACAVNGCDHRCCQGGPFSLVFLFSIQDDDYTFKAKELVVCKYSSSTREWDKLMISFDTDSRPSYAPSILIGQTLYFRLQHQYILEYQLDGQEAIMIPIPWEEHLAKSKKRGNITLVAAHGGELGIVAVEEEESRLLLLSRVKGGHDDDVTWACCKVMDLDKLVPRRQIDGSDFIPERRLHGYAEGMNTIFICHGFDVFAIQLNSQRVKKVCQLYSDCPVFPLVTFYTPVAVRLKAGRDGPSSTDTIEEELGAHAHGSTNEENRTMSSRVKKPNAKFLGGDWVNQ